MIRSTASLLDLPYTIQKCMNSMFLYMKAFTNKKKYQQMKHIFSEGLAHSSIIWNIECRAATN